MILKVKDIEIGRGRPLVLIAGPCVIENERQTMVHAEAIKKIAERIQIPFIFKSSYDKANRLSISSFRGPGLVRGLRILKKVRREFDIPVLSDVHSVEEVKDAASVLDIIQIPALLCRQTDLVVCAARTKKAINLKKGQFISPYDMKNIIEKLERAGNRNILLTERGVSFGYNNLVCDMRSLAVMAEYGYPVVFDATHSVQLPGGRGTASGGERRFVPVLSRAAVAAGCDGLFLEVHRNPKSAPCDGANMLPLDKLEGLLVTAKEIHAIEKG